MAASRRASCSSVRRALCLPESETSLAIGASLRRGRDRCGHAGRHHRAAIPIAQSPRLQQASPRSWPVESVAPMADAPRCFSFKTQTATGRSAHCRLATAITVGCPPAPLAIGRIRCRHSPAWFRRARPLVFRIGGTMDTEQAKAERFQARVKTAGARLDELEASARARHAQTEMDAIARLREQRNSFLRRLDDARATPATPGEAARREVEDEWNDFQRSLADAQSRSAWDDARERRFQRSPRRA